MTDQWKTADTLYERLGRAQERATDELGMAFAFRNFPQIAGPTLASIEQAIGEHLAHPEINLPHLAHATGVETVVRLPPDIYADLEEQVRVVERRIEQLIAEKN